MSECSPIRRRTAITALTIAAATCVFANAAVAQALESDFSFTIIETNAQGQEQQIERDDVEPGEMIEYTLRHENTSDAPLAGLVIRAPVPVGVTLKPAAEFSSIPARFEVQAELDPEQDGLEWAALPAMRRVADAQGALVEEPLPNNAIVAVRWTLDAPLAAGETALNGYRVQVN